jgi:hypothetical protein
MSSEQIWAVGFAMLLTSIGAGMFFESHYDNVRSLECERRGNEWRPVGQVKGKMGCVVVNKKEPS